MGSSIGINLGPSRGADAAIGLDPWNRDRLVIKRRLQTGCLAILGAALVWLCWDMQASPEPFGHVAGIVLLGFLFFGRRWIVFDRRAASVEEFTGVRVPGRGRSLAGIRKVLISRVEEVSRSRDTESTTTRVLVQIRGYGESLTVASTGVWETGRGLAETISHFLDLPLEDRVAGESLAPAELELSLRQKWETGRLLPMAKSAIGRKPGRRRGADRKKPPPFLEPLLPRKGYRVENGPDASLRIHIPRPRQHRILGLAILVFLFWTVPVSLFGGILFALLPTAMLLLGWVKIAYGYAAELEVTPSGLVVKAKGLILRRRLAFPAEEIEDLAVLKPERGGSRELLFLSFPGFLVARSDRQSVRFGYGLTAEQLDELRWLLLDKLARSPGAQNSAASPDRSPRPCEFEIPTLYRPTEAAIGWSAGALLGNAAGGVLGICVAVPFWEHVLNAGGALGLALGMLFESFRRRRTGPGLALQRLWPCLLLLVPLAARLLAGGPVIVPGPVFDEASLLFTGKARDPLFALGFVPTVLLGMFVLSAPFAHGLELLLVLAGFATRSIAVAVRVIRTHRLSAVLCLVFLLLSGAWLFHARAFFAAVKEGSFPLMSTLLALDPALLNRPGTNRGTALHLAATYDNPEVLRFLLERHADPGSLDATRQTPLHRCRSIECASLLLRHGASLDARDQFGVTPLLKASGEEMARFLLSRGASPWERDQDGNTALHWGAYDPGLVELFLEKGLPADARNARAVTPLMVAATLGNVDSMAALLRQGADPNAQDAAGDTPLHHAVRAMRREEALVLLLERKGDPIRPNTQGASPADLARSLSWNAGLEILGRYVLPERPAGKK